MSDGVQQPDSSNGGALSKAASALAGGKQRLVTAAAIGFGIVEIFRSDPKDGLALLAQYGPKYLLWAIIAYFIFVLLCRGLDIAKQGVDNIGLMAVNTGNVANSVNALATKSDRTAEEMRRLCSFAASQSERSVELSREAVDAAKLAVSESQANGALLRQMFDHIQAGSETKKENPS